MTDCGFCIRGMYHYASGRRGECPYCGGTGKAPGSELPIEETEDATDD